MTEEDRVLKLHITAVSAGLLQGDWAIKLLTENDQDTGALISAYTLAGAAEELFSRLISESGTENAYSLTKKAYEDAGIANADPNVFRNWLKHASYKNPETKKQEIAPIVDASGLQEQVAFMIIRAAINLSILRNSTFKEMVRFQNWLEKNIPNLFSEEMRTRSIRSIHPAGK